MNVGDSLLVARMQVMAGRSGEEDAWPLL